MGFYKFITLEMGFGYIGGHGAENKKRLDSLGKPKYFDKTFNKNNHTRTKIPHLNTHATPQQMAELKKKLKRQKIKSVVISLISLGASIGILYFLAPWIF